MSDFQNTLTEKETESILSALINTDKDTLFIKYLNQDGRMALFQSIIKEYPIKRVASRVYTTVLVYNLLKSLGISRPQQILGGLFNTNVRAINQRIQTAKAKGYSKVNSFDEAKKQYIEAMS
jgi:hypothetical protein